jgi:hypothetical protein
MRLSLKERRSRFANATNIHRKSGGAKPRDLQFRGPLLEMFRQSVWRGLQFFYYWIFSATILA